MLQGSVCEDTDEKPLQSMQGISMISKSIPYKDNKTVLNQCE